MDLPTRIRRGAQGVSSRIGTRNNGGRRNSEQHAKKPTQRLTERIRACKRSLSDLILGPSRSPDSPVTADVAGQQSNDRVVLPAGRVSTSSSKDLEVAEKLASDIAPPLNIAEYSMGLLQDRPDAQHASTLRDLTGVGSHLPAYSDRGVEQNKKQTDSYRDSIGVPRSSGEFNLNFGLPSPRSTFGYPTRTSSCTTTSSRSEAGQRHKRFSSLWAHESFNEDSTTESVFSGRAQSTISISSVGTIEAPFAEEARPSATKRQRLSSSSIGTLSSHYNDVNLDEHPLPSPPSSAGLRTFRKSIDRSSTESLNITSQLLPFEKPPKKPNSERPERPVLKIEPVSGFLSIGEMDGETSAKPLSIISEGNSDAANSFMDASPIQPPGPYELLPIPPGLTRLSRRSFSDSTSEIPTSIASPAQMVSTCATSIAEHSDLDTSEDESLASDEMDETDDPFLEAFAASSLDPNLLPFILNLKDHLVNQVASRVAEWVRSHALEPADSDSGGNSSASLSPNDSNGSGPGKGGRKRSLFGEGGNSPEKEDGDGEQGKRRRTEPNIFDRVELGTFACPFTKRYPDKKWPKCQKKGWKEVHRIKEHIYRTHMLAPHCERCFTEFETEAERAAHSRQQVPCDVIEPPTTMIGITPEIKDKLKSRKGIQNLKEDSKWRAMYKVLFEDQTDIPSPYYDCDMSAGPMSQTQCTQFIRQQSNYCEREICGLLEKRLHNEPGYGILRARVFETIREAFDTYFTKVTPETPGMTPRSEGPQPSGKPKSPALAMSPLELDACSKQNTSPCQSLDISSRDGRGNHSEGELHPQNEPNLPGGKIGGNLTSQPWDDGSHEIPSPPKLVENNEAADITCLGSYYGVMQAGEYGSSFNFSDEIGDSFDFYGDRPLDFYGEEHPWLDEPTGHKAETLQ